jgi:TonB family protein
MSVIIERIHPRPGGNEYPVRTSRGYELVEPPDVGSKNKVEDATADLIERRRFPIGTGIVLAFLLFCSAPLALCQASFKPPEAVSVTDAYIPYQIMLDGFVVLKVSLSAKGRITKIEGLRDPGSIIFAAISCVDNWKFHPGYQAKMPLASEMTVVLVYRPPSNLAAVRDFNPVIPYAQADTAEKPAYVPVGIRSVAYPAYPWNAVTWGSVVVQVTVNRDGEAEHVQTLKDLAPFTQPALDALKKWKFVAATLGGQPVSAKVPIAFVFQLPL